METLNTNNAASYTTFPNNRVCGIINTSEHARDAVNDLFRAHIPEESLNIFYGSSGIQELDAEASRHVIGAKIAKTSRSYGHIEYEALRIYEDAMRKGSFIFEVLAEDDEQKQDIHTILATNHAHEINYFGT
ncbi:MAG: hypothetical protein ABI778_03700 [Ignavibacteriota bacterium]